MSKATTQLTERVDITIEKRKTDTEPPIYTVELIAKGREGGQGGSWCEAFGSRDQLNAFLRGLSAGSMMLGGGYIPQAEVP